MSNCKVFYLVLLFLFLLNSCSYENEESNGNEIMLECVKNSIDSIEDKFGMQDFLIDSIAYEFSNQKGKTEFGFSLFNKNQSDEITIRRVNISFCENQRPNQAELTDSNSILNIFFTDIDFEKIEHLLINSHTVRVIYFATDSLMEQRHAYILGDFNK